MKRSVSLILAAVLALYAPLHAQPRKNVLRAAQRAANKHSARADAKLLHGRATKQSRKTPAPADISPAKPEPPDAYEEVSYRPTNRQARKQPVQKIRLDKENLPPWVRVKRGHVNANNISKGDLVGSIVARHHNMNSALADIRRLEAKYGRQDFFHIFSVAYYRKQMGGLSPLFYDFLKRVSRSNDDAIQTAVAARMQFLIQYKNRFLASFNPGKTLPGDWTLYWLTDRNSLRSAQFDPERLVYSRERTLRPGREDARLDHVHQNTYVRVNGKRLPLVYFPGELDHLPKLYKKLLYPYPQDQKIFVTMDRPNGLMLIYNDTRDKWIRVSRHEFSDPSNLHVHLNKLENVSLHLGSGQTHRDRIVNNLSIPLKPRPHLNARELEDIFFEQTLARLAQDPDVRIEFKTLY